MTYEIKVKGISQETYDKINLCFEHSKFPDRSAYIINALELHMLYNDSAFIRLLPDTLRILVEDIIAKEIKKHGDLLELALISIQKDTESRQQLWRLLNNDNVPESDENDDF